MRSALFLLGCALIVASIAEIHIGINAVRFRTSLFSVMALYNPNGVKGVLVWGAGDDGKADRPGLLNWTWR